MLAVVMLADLGAAVLGAAVPAGIDTGTQFRTLAQAADLYERHAGVTSTAAPVAVAYSGAVGPVGIPARVLAAYRRGAVAMVDAAPGCGLTWWMLAAIGKMESDHAAGGRLDAAGTTRTPILGPVLDGSNGTAAIPTRADRSGWTRAMGPMQFLPATWAAYGQGGDPQNIDDATMAAARYLCAGGADLADPADLTAAILRYNHSETYLEAVLAWASTYATGSVVALLAPTDTGAAPAAPDVSDAATKAAADVAVAFATGQAGLPYVWGGDGPDNGDAGFDCSGLTHAAYEAAGIFIPRTAQTQYDAGPALQSSAPLEAGDLVFYGTPDRVHHVGLYLGDGKMVNAPTFGQPVQLADYRWVGDDFVGATRPAARPGSLPLVAPSRRRTTSTAADRLARSSLGSSPVVFVPPQAQITTTPVGPRIGPAAVIAPSPVPLAVVPTPVVPTPVVPTPVVPTPVVPTPVVPTPVVRTPLVPTPVVPTLQSPTPVVPTLQLPTPVLPKPAVPTAASPVVTPVPVVPAVPSPRVAPTLAATAKTAAPLPVPGRLTPDQLAPWLLTLTPEQRAAWLAGTARAGS